MNKQEEQNFLKKMIRYFSEGDINATTLRATLGEVSINYKIQCCTILHAFLGFPNPSVTVLKLLLKEGFDPRRISRCKKIKCVDYNFLDHLFTDENWNINILGLLLIHGMPVDARGPYLLHAYLKTRRNHNIEFIQLLLDKRVSVNKKYGGTCLHAYFSRNYLLKEKKFINGINPHIVKLLLGAGVDPYVTYDGKLFFEMTRAKNPDHIIPWLYMFVLPRNLPCNNPHYQEYAAGRLQINSPALWAPHKVMMRQILLCCKVYRVTRHIGYLFLLHSLTSLHSFTSLHSLTSL